MPASAHARDMNPAGVAGHTILIVEDEPIISADLEQTFVDAGATVWTAGSVEGALRLLDRTPVDAAVLDVNLGNGTTCAEVAERLQRADVPFILHSGNLRGHGDLVETIGAPIVMKPAPSEALVNRLADLLAG